MTCSFDYLTDSVNNMAFTAFFFGFCYVLPLLFIIFFYSQIVMAVVSHERALKAQAKKMNVDSLRSNEVTVELLKHVSSRKLFHIKYFFRTRMLKVLKSASPKLPLPTFASGCWPGHLMALLP